MADESRGPGDGLFYALLGGLCVVIAGGGLYVYKNSGNLLDTESAPPIAAVQSVAPSASQISQARSAIADARRLGLRGDFNGAENALQSADRVAPGFSETTMARGEIADMRKARGEGRRDRIDRRRHDGRITTLVDSARAAIARRDYAAADRALDEAEHIDSHDDAVVRARHELTEASQPSHRN